ncbi:MAG: type II toxin-antitoxin system PemK/MazF family toxin [Chloroflexi bacterium]|nr:type II toxin-antitoxin system PemK/MazF family toxin [Chloroflexota bacterium]
MAGILRGEVIWADLYPARGHEQAGRRPVVVISYGSFNVRSGTVIAMSVTSQPQRQNYPLTLELRDAGLPRRSWVKISQVHTLSVERLRGTIGFVTESELDMLVAGLNELITE